MKFSIIIPARNAESTIARCLQSIREMDFDPEEYEVIVVDDASRDRTSKIAEDFRAKVIRRRESGSVAEVRNIGAKEANGEILAHLDSDMVVDPRWLARAEEYYFGRGHNGALYFVDNVPEEAGWLDRLWYGPIRKKRSGAREVDYLPTRGLFVSKKLHEESGGLDEELFHGRRGGSDKEFTYRLRRAGYSVVSDPSLRMIHLGYGNGLGDFVKKELWHQGSTLLIAKKFHYPLHLLKNPLLSGFHILCALGLVIGLLAGGSVSLATFAILWTAPSLLEALVKMDMRRYWSYVPSVWLLTFLRWNIAGLALIPQLIALAGERWTAKR